MLSPVSTRIYKSSRGAPPAPPWKVTSKDRDSPIRRPESSTAAPGASGVGGDGLGLFGMFEIVDGGMGTGEVDGFNEGLGEAVMVGMVRLAAHMYPAYSRPHCDRVVQRRR